MKTKHKLNVILSILLSLSMLQVPVFASEVSGTVSENASVFEEMLDTSESDALAGEESVDGAFYADTMVPISEDLSEASGSTRSNDSEWITADISNLLYMTGAFPKPEDFDYTGCPELDIFENLSDKDEFSGLIYNAIKNRTNPSDVSRFSLTPSQVSSRIATVINQTPEFFYANKSYQYCLDDDGCVRQIILFAEKINSNRRTVNLASADGLDWNARNKILDEKADEIISGIDPRWSDEEVALYLYNWLETNCVYDWDTFREWGKKNYEYNDGIGYTAYGAIVVGKAVCNGTALAYMYLMDKAGIPCEYVRDDMHAWNLIQIDNKNYYVDPTASSGMGSSCNYPWSFMNSTTKFCIAYPGSTPAEWRIGDKSGDSIITSTDHDDYYWCHCDNSSMMPQNGNLVAHISRKSENTFSNACIYNYSDKSDTLIDKKYGTIDGLAFVGDYIAVTNHPEYIDGQGYIEHSGRINIELIDPSTNQIIDSYEFTDAPIDRWSTCEKLLCENGIITYILEWPNEDGEYYDENGTPIYSLYDGTLDWSKYVNNPETVTITFDSNGGSPVPAQTIQYSGKAAYPDEPKNGNLYFTGWYTDKNLIRKFSFNANVKWDMTLYAGWSDTKPEETLGTPEMPTETNISKSTVLMSGSKIVDKDLKKSKSDKKRYKAKSSNKKVATVSSKGMITAKKEGTATITVRKADKTITYTVTVVAKPKLTFTQPLTKTGQTMSISENCIVSADGTTITPVKYTSSKPSVATIDANTGVITAGEKDGKTKITAYYAIKGKDGALKTITTKGKLIVKHEQ